MFFLSHHNRIRIPDMLVSPIFAELLELRDMGLGGELEQSNWFSVNNTSRLYSLLWDLACLMF